MGCLLGIVSTLFGASPGQSSSQFKFVQGKPLSFLCCVEVQEEARNYLTVLLIRYVEFLSSNDNAINF